MNCTGVLYNLQYLTLILIQDRKLKEA